MPSIREIVDRFNNNELDVENYFGDYNSFFTIVKKKGLMSEIDPIHHNNSEEWVNDFMLWLLNNDLETFKFWVAKILDDVEFNQNGDPILVLKDEGDLAKLFCDNRRNDLNPKTIGQILSGDHDWFDWVSHTTDNVHRDVIEELNDKNLRILYDHIVFELKESKIDPETELLENIAQEQGHEEYATIDQSNIESVVDDEETMKYLLKNELSEVNTDLYNIHNSAYNDAYSIQIEKDIWYELGTFFEGKGYWESTPHPFKRETMIEIKKLPINNFYSNIGDFLQDNLNAGDTLFYQGSYLNILGDFNDCLSVRVSDYPDFSLVDRNINDNFNNYF